MDIKLPSLGEGADSGTVVSVLAKEGDSIEKGQPILELENEKAVASVPSTAAGVVAKIHVKVGDKLSVGQRILSIEGGNAEPRADAQKPVSEDRKLSGIKKSISEDADQNEQEPPDQEGEEEFATGVPPAASPSIRKLAGELGIDLRRVRGSERGGRIVMGDLKAYIQRLEKLAARTNTKTEPESVAKLSVEPMDFSKWGTISRKPLSPLRKVISRRMTENWTTIPHVTQFDEADITALQELRKKIAGSGDLKGPRITLTPFLLKAVLGALQKHPIFNSSFDEAAGEIVLKQYYHFGIAVDTDAGLIVPILRDVDKKSLVELAKELEDIAQKARERKVSADELKGGTFTISNQGGIGGSHFTPIINKPEVAILGLGRSIWKPVVRESQIVSRMMLPLALSYDHRVIDGGSAARFIVDLVKGIENFKEPDIAN